MKTQTFIEKIVDTDVDSLLAFKSKCDHAYHNTGEPLITDSQYDQLVEVIQRKRPSSTLTIGAVPNSAHKVKLPYHMGSMDKIKPENVKELRRWLERNKADIYVVEPKLDGISALLVVGISKLSLYTRGDGSKGTDISKVLPHIHNIPKTNQILCIRGELIVNKKIFEKKYKGKFSNARNFVSGVIMSNNASVKYLSDIEFVAYEIIQGEDIQMEPVKQFKLLKELNFQTVKAKLYKRINVPTLKDALEKYKSNLQYEVDGVILHPNKRYVRNTYGNPSYSIAFKSLGKVYTTDVQDVIWQVSKWGKIVPRIKVSTVDIDGVNVSYTTGFNAKYIIDNSLGVGSVVAITRSGDVIPYIVDVVKKAKRMVLPDIKYKWSDSKVDFEIAEENEEKYIKTNLAFFKGMGIKNVNIQTVRKFYRNGYRDIFQILNASVEDIQQLSGFKKKMSEKIYTSIHNDEKYELWVILGSAGAFGKGISSKKLKKLFLSHNDILKTHSSLSKEQLMDKILGVEGFSEKTAAQVVSHIEQATVFYDKIFKYFDILPVKSNISTKSTLLNKKVVFTGFRDKSLEQSVNERGGMVTSNVSRTTFIVVTKDRNPKSSTKLNKAKELKVTITDKASFTTDYLL